MAAGRIFQPTTIIAKDQLELAESSRIDSYCLINANGGVRLRKESTIHSGSRIIGNGGFEMGPRSVVTYNCVVTTSTVDLGYPATNGSSPDRRRVVTDDVRLERETFVGSGAVIMPGVTLHEGAVVAANAYVDSDVPPWTIRYPDGSERPRRTKSPLFEGQ